MGILTRLNVLVGLTAVVAACIAGYVSRAILEAETARELLAEAGMMLDSAVAMRSYTSSEIEPLLVAGCKRSFFRRASRSMRPRKISCDCTRNFPPIRTKRPP